MDETARNDLKEKGKKSKKKKKKRPHPTTSGVCLRNAYEVGGERLVDEVSQLEEPAAEETLQTHEGSWELCSPNVDTAELPTGKAGGEQLVGEVSQLEEPVVERALQTIEGLCEDKGLDNSILEPDVCASEFVQQGFFANAVATQGTPHEANENVLAQHYWGARRGHSTINKWLNLDVHRRQRRGRVAECAVDVETKCSVVVQAKCPTVPAEQPISCPVVELPLASDPEDVEVQGDNEAHLTTMRFFFGHPFHVWLTRKSHIALGNLLNLFATSGIRHHK